MNRSTIAELCSINPEVLGSGTPPDVDFRYVDISSVNSGRINWSETRQIMFADAPSRARRVIRSGDVLLCTVRPGLMSHAKIGRVDRKLVCSTGFAVLRPKLSEDSSYIYQQLFSDQVAAQYRALETGSNYPALNERDIETIRLYTPNASERTRIARILDTADALIAAAGAVVAKLRQVREGLLHDLLTRGLAPNGQLRDPAANPKQFKDSPLGRIPREWEVRRLGDAIEMRSGDGLTGEQINEAGEFPVYGGNGLRGFTERFTHDGDYVLIGRQGALCGNICIASGRFYATEHAVVCTPKVAANPVWLANVLERMNLNRFSESSAQPGLAVGKISNLPLALPSKPEQDSIASLLATHDRLIAAEQTELTKLRQLKSGLMTDLLEGRVRVPEDLPEETARHPAGTRVNSAPR